MSVLFHPFPTSCTPAARKHPGSALPPQQRRGMRTTLSSPYPSPSSSSSSSSRAKFLHFCPRRCIYDHRAPADTKPTLPAPSRRLSSTEHPWLSWKVPLFAAQPCRCSTGDGGASTVARCTRLPGTLHYGVPDGATSIWGAQAGVSRLRWQQPSTSRVAATAQPSSSKKEDKLVTEGLITELLPNCMFRVRLDNGEVILGYVSGKMRTMMVRVMVGDRVRIEVSRYDSTKGRIVYRLRSKSSAD